MKVPTVIMINSVLKVNNIYTFLFTFNLVVFHIN